MGRWTGPPEPDWPPGWIVVTVAVLALLALAIALYPRLP
jgi:hypothetical protein